MHAVIAVALIFSLFERTFCFPKQFTFELPDKQRMCFYETLEDSKRYIIFFRVIRGGNNDVDIKLTSPAKVVIYENKKAHFDTHIFTATKGVHSLCFSNEFSSITHKQVFFELRPENFESLDEEAGRTKRPTAETLMESAMDKIHSSLSQVEEYQTEYRTREAEGRALSEDLNERVLFWSIVVAVSVIVTGFGQVTILKNFFSDKKVSFSHSNRI